MGQWVGCYAQFPVYFHDGKDTKSFFSVETRIFNFGLISVNSIVLKPGGDQFRFWLIFFCGSHVEKSRFAIAMCCLWLIGAQTNQFSNHYQKPFNILQIVRNQKPFHVTGFTVILIFLTIFEFLLKIIFVHRNGQYNNLFGWLREVFILILRICPDDGWEQALLVS